MARVAHERASIKDKNFRFCDFAGSERIFIQGSWIISHKLNEDEEEKLYGINLREYLASKAVHVLTRLWSNASLFRRLPVLW